MTRKNDTGSPDIDMSLIEMISRWAGDYVASIQGQGSSSLYSPEEKKRVIELIREHNRGPLPDTVLEKIFTEIISAATAATSPSQGRFPGS